jgi:hypothetical protein
MFILRDMVNGGLLGQPFIGEFTWHGTNDRCETAPVHGLEYRTGDTVLQKVYAILDQSSGSGPSVVHGDPAYDAENDRVTRTVTRSHPVLIESDAVAAIKIEARRRILEVYPDWKQVNMTARGVELVRIKADGGTWSTGEAAEAGLLDSAWTWIKAVRAASDAIETDAGTLTLQDIQNDSRWPE